MAQHLVIAARTECPVLHPILREDRFPYWLSVRQSIDEALQLNICRPNTRLRWRVIFCQRTKLTKNIAVAGSGTSRSKQWHLIEELTSRLTGAGFTGVRVECIVRHQGAAATDFDSRHTGFKRVSRMPGSPSSETRFAPPRAPKPCLEFVPP